MAIQRQPYKGQPLRSWLQLSFKARDGLVHSFAMVADTGCPAAVIIRPDLMALLAFNKIPKVISNFGELHGGWIRLYNPEFGLVEFVRAYGSAEVAQKVAKSHPDFVGLVGLPILRLGQYGGNENEFWFRYPPNNPSSTTP